MTQNRTKQASGKRHHCSCKLPDGRTCKARAVDRFRGRWTCAECLNPEPSAEYLAEERSAAMRVQSSFPDADREGCPESAAGCSVLYRLLEARIREHKIPRMPGHQLRGVGAKWARRSDG